jgi:hypothetical protein
MKRVTKKNSKYSNDLNEPMWIVMFKHYLEKIDNYLSRTYQKLENANKKNENIKINMYNENENILRGEENHFQKLTNNKRKIFLSTPKKFNLNDEIDIEWNRSYFDSFIFMKTNLSEYVGNALDKKGIILENNQELVIEQQNLTRDVIQNNSENLIQIAEKPIVQQLNLNQPSNSTVEQTDELGSDAINKNGVFRLQNVKIHLTYPDHVDCQEMLDFIIFKTTQTPIGYSIVQEIGETGHNHTHVLLKFKTAITTTVSRFFDINGLHPNIKKVITAKHWNNCVVYHKKQGTPLTNITELDNENGKKSAKDEIERIWSCKSAGDAILHMCESVKEVGGVIAAFNCKPIEYGEEPIRNWKPWQLELYTEMDEEPDDRSIIWYADTKGNAGKTFFAKHMGMYKGTFVSTKANVYHVATQIQDVIKQGDSILSVIFNFTRQTEYHKVYQALESLKDGMVTSEKFHGKTMYFKSPHVVVFANYFPDLLQISTDRWKLRVLDNEGMYCKHKLTNVEIEFGIESMMLKRFIGRNEAARIFTEELKE